MTNPWICGHVPRNLPVCQCLSVHRCIPVWHSVWLSVSMCMVFLYFLSMCVCRRAVSFSLVVSIIRRLPFLLFTILSHPSLFFTSNWSFHFPSLTHIHLHPFEWQALNQSFILAKWWTGRNSILFPPLILRSISVLTWLCSLFS